MKKLIRIALLCAAAGFSTLAAAEIAVIVHPDNGASLSKSEVERIFLGKMHAFPAGGTVTPFNLAEGTELRSSFDQNVVGKSSSQLKAYWSKQIFTGKGTPPEEVADAAAMKAKVSSDPSAIGYVDAAEVDGSVRVIGHY